MGSIKDRNGTDLTDNHNGVITHLEPDILEYKVKWALECITMNKASGGEAIPAELFQVLNNDAVKGLHSMYHQILKTSAVAIGLENAFSLQSQRRSMPKNVQTITQLYTFHMLAR